MELKASEVLDQYQAWTLTKWNRQGINSLYPSEWVEQLLNSTVGLEGEDQELTDLVKKVAFHRAVLSDDMKEKMAKELGDRLFYIAITSYLLGVTLGEVVEKNQTKLNIRYPSGFDPDIAAALLVKREQEGR